MATNPCIRSEYAIYADSRKARQRELRRRKRAIRRYKLMAKRIGLTLIMAALVYAMAAPPLNPIKYEWIKVRVKDGDTLSGIQREHVPDGNMKILLFQLKLKNECTEHIEPGQYVYVLAKKGAESD